MNRFVPPNNDLETYRAALRLAVQLEVDPELEAKLDLSGVVQQTLWEAHRGSAEFRGQSEGEWLAWLRRILLHNLIDEIRKVARSGHDARLEVSLEKSSLRLSQALAAQQTPPDLQAVRNEELLLLAQGMERLTGEQRQAVVRHHLQGVSLAQVASEMGKSREAVAGLIHRGLARLREALIRHG